MASYATAALSFLLVVVLFTTLKVEARESKFFSNFNPEVDQPPLKPSSEINNFNGYNFENSEGDIPVEDLTENIKEDSSETNGFPRDFDERFVPQDSNEKESNDFYYPDKSKPSEGVDKQNMDASANNGFDLTAEEDKFFDVKQGMNGFATGYKNDDENAHANEAQGMSDTRTLENKYLPEPEDLQVIDIGYMMYMKFKDYPRALQIAMFWDNMQYVKQVFISCNDTLQKKQFCFILARHGFTFELDDDMCADDEEKEAMQEIVKQYKIN
ncbi:hypothetical protein POM88_028162 [Heracleum sosnowskyi]|uniref:RPN1 N-terminal domain-containing protein n=1 Tax=Heracleum sosnowskyi TaxID=360622 RepID=A0AAD8IBK8_9APIA|nr:hypothetical protein POM88_028162 [Heracleum sosnowskyi]